MSRLAPGLIELNKGLDLNTAKIAAPEGTLLDSLNYEQVDFQGQKRIDGYVRYDGSKGSYIDDFLRIEGVTGTPGDIVHLSSSGELGAEGKLFGIVVGSSDGSIDVAVIDETLIPKLSAAHTWGTKAAGLTPDEHYELILLYNQVLRERTTSLPGPVAGLHWFRDRLYAVADVLAVIVEETEPEECLELTSFGLEVAFAYPEEGSEPPAWWGEMPFRLELPSGNYTAYTFNTSRGEYFLDSGNGGGDDETGYAYYGPEDTRVYVCMNWRGGA